MPTFFFELEGNAIDVCVQKRYNTGVTEGLRLGSRLVVIID